MAFVRLQHHRPAPKSFNNFVDGFFATVPSLFREDSGAIPKSAVPVNIIEREAEYELEIVAPGLNREDFKISLDNNTLTISAERKAGEKNENEKLIRREYRYPSFSRSFTIDENIDADNIAAKYTNGVLTLNLPRKGEVKSPAKQISIQ